MPAACAVTFGGSSYPVIDGMIHLPRVGVWHADLRLSAPGSSSSNLIPTGQASIRLGSQTLQGTFGLAGTTKRDTLRVHIAGGGNGFGKTLLPKGYRSISLRSVIGDILQDAGETLSSTADPGVLATQVPFWTRIQSSAGLALAAALAVTGASWRVLGDGTVWLGAETYPPAPPMDIVQLSFQPELARYEFQSYDPVVLPGQTFNGQRVSALVHYLDPDSLKSQLYFE